MGKYGYPRAGWWRTTTLTNWYYPFSDSNWILATGNWNDSGVWDDNSNWID